MGLPEFVLVCTPSRPFILPLYDIISGIIFRGQASLASDYNWPNRLSPVFIHRAIQLFNLTLLTIATYFMGAIPQFH
jgi:hypothetical protein